MAIHTYSQKMLADTEAEILLVSANLGDTAYAIDTTLSYRYNGTQWLPSDGVRVFRGANNLDCKTNGNTVLLFTVPSATVFRFMPLAAHIEAISITGTLGVAPSLSAGTNSTSFNDVFSSSVLTALLTGSTQTNALTVGASITPLVAGKTITAKVNSAATLYTAYSVRVDIMGSYEQ